MTLTQFNEVPRDRWKRPLIYPPGKVKTTAYTRCTTYVGVLEDRYALQQWAQRMTAMGIANRDDLRLAVIAHKDDKKALNEICEAAVTAAKEQDAAIVGTALHALTDQWDRHTLDLNNVPETWRKDVEAYARATEKLSVIGIEVFGVHDDLKIAGTADRLYGLPDKRTLIGDTKSGSVEYGQGKIAMQLAVYSRCTPYQHDGDPRRGVPHPEWVNQDTALVVHLPAGKGTCELIEVDIKAGWLAVDLATRVRAWRARKDLFRPFELLGGGEDVAGPTSVVGPVQAETNTTTEDPIFDLDEHIHDLIVEAKSPAELRELWSTFKNVWTEAHTVSARAQTLELTA